MGTEGGNICCMPITSRAVSDLPHNLFEHSVRASVVAFMRVLPSSPFPPPVLSTEALLIVQPSLDKFKINAAAYHGYHFARSMTKHHHQDLANFYEVACTDFRDGFRTCLRRFRPLPRLAYPFSSIDN